MRMSARLHARIARGAYLLTFAPWGVAFFAGGKTLVAGDAAATATGILAHEPLFWLGFAAYLLNVVVYIVVTLLFHNLFRPVNRSLSLLAVFFSLVGCAVQASACVFQLGARVVLEGGPTLHTFTLQQQQELALLLLKLHSRSFNIGLVFFGVYCLLIGFLVVRATFLPRAIGVLMMLAGLGWLTFLSPPLARSLSPYVLLPGIVGEGSLTLWLLLMGIDLQRWKEKVAAGDGNPADAGRLSDRSSA